MAADDDRKPAALPGGGPGDIEAETEVNDAGDARGARGPFDTPLPGAGHVVHPANGTPLLLAMPPMSPIRLPGAEAADARIAGVPFVAPALCRAWSMGLAKSTSPAIKRSLDEDVHVPSPEGDMHRPPDVAAEGHCKRPRVAPTELPIEELPSEGGEAAAALERPTIDKCIRNVDPEKIDEFGFVEISGALSPQLLAAARREADAKLARMHCKPGRQDVEEISNALQVDVSEGLLRQMVGSIEGCDKIRKTMEVVFGKEGAVSMHCASADESTQQQHPVPSGTETEGEERPSRSNYNGFVIETPKVLVTLPGSHPQLPHADDHCTSCLICLLHLGDDQEPTRVAKYDGASKEYPTGIQVECDKCKRSEMLPDSDFRRGVHLTDEPWHCNCEAPQAPHDFEGNLLKAFGELLETEAPDLCDSYCGKRSTLAGDGYLALPTLIHRGPGNASSATKPRYMLFFTLRPAYKNTKSEAAYHKKYDSDLQIHASCMLFHQFSKVQSIYESKGCSLEGSFNAIELIAGRRNAQLMKSENKRSKGRVSEGGYATLLRENDDLRQEISRLKTVLADNGVSEDGSAAAQGSALTKSHASMPAPLEVAAANESPPTANAKTAAHARPNRLAIGDDASEVNKLHQYVRRDLLELFVVPETTTDSKEDGSDGENDDCDDKEEKIGNESATNARRPARSCRSLSQSTNPQSKPNKSSKYPGRVGFRCVHCANSACKTAKKSSFYPLRLSNIYREVCAWQRLHFGECKAIPADVRKRYFHYKESDNSRGKVRYWESSARKIGLVNNPERSDGIIFSKAVQKA